ncbi:MAG: biotin--[acetyl-CoA-carboxylase] ligase [Bacillota bacterium]
MKPRYKRTHFESLESTNDYVKNHLETLPDHTLITTDFQSKGRGRRERTWESLPGFNFLGTFYKRSSGVRQHEPMIQGVLSIIGTLESLGIDAEIKPPNDVYVRGRKIAGILSEVIHNNKKHVIIGIGFNVNEPKATPAIALSEVTGSVHDLEGITDTIIRHMAIEETRNFATLFERYVARIPFGRIVAFKNSDRLGFLESIDGDFRCVVDGTPFPCEALRFQYR